MCFCVESGGSKIESCCEIYFFNKGCVFYYFIYFRNDVVVKECYSRGLVVG